METLKSNFSTNEDFKDEFKEHYDRLISPDFIDTPRDQIRSSGYVVDTIEAAVWSLLNSDNYADCVLLAVNLGGDTDTIAAIAGGIAGLVYGEDMIPDKWVATLLIKINELRRIAMDLKIVRALIYGHAIGDALGVPVEFSSRTERMVSPVTSMRSNFAREFPAGTWADDTSLSIALLESLGRLGKIDYTDIMDNFVKWYDDDEFTALGDPVDEVGMRTSTAILGFKCGMNPTNCGGDQESDNGNGSLMRIDPIVLYLHEKFGENLATDESMEFVHNISSLTHAHARSKIACGILILILNEILNGAKDLKIAIRDGISKAREFYSAREDFANEFSENFARVSSENFAETPRDDIHSSGYVIDTLEASIWCLLNSKDYSECVLKAVNLGIETNTTAAVAGGVAGLFYGFDAIPAQWIDTLQAKSLLDEICEKFASQTF